MFQPPCSGKVARVDSEENFGPFQKREWEYHMYQFGAAKDDAESLHQLFSEGWEIERSVGLSILMKRIKNVRENRPHVDSPSGPSNSVH
jgi:hypothetical protein